MTTLTLLHYPPRNRVWAFAQMAFAVPALRRTPGLRFWKLLGSGHGSGFSLQPNWARYGLLGVWEDREAAQKFFAHAPLMQKYRSHADEIWTAYMLPRHAHGTWSGVNPFQPFAATAADGPVAVLTRATLRLRRMRAFWSEVPGTSRILENAAGRLASIGLGEAPFFRQATFSLWESETEMQAFAYRSDHQRVIRRTREEHWYREELFARFAPIASVGTWDGRDPLAGLVEGENRP